MILIVNFFKKLFYEGDLDRSLKMVIVSVLFVAISTFLCCNSHLSKEEESPQCVMENGIY